MYWAQLSRMLNLLYTSQQLSTYFVSLIHSFWLRIVSIFLLASMPGPGCRRPTRLHRLAVVCVVVVGQHRIELLYWLSL